MDGHPVPTEPPPQKDPPKNDPIKPIIPNIRRPRKKFGVNIPGIKRVPESTTAVPNAPSSTQCPMSVIPNENIPAPANTSLDNNSNEQLKDIVSIEKPNEIADNIPAPSLDKVNLDEQLKDTTIKEESSEPVKSETKIDDGTIPSPRKSKGRAKPRPEMSQLAIRKKEMRKKFAKGPVEPNEMKLFDMIYYNIDGTKVTGTQEKLVTRRRPLESEAAPKRSDHEDVNDLLEKRLAEEKQMSKMEGEEEEDYELVPRVRLGPDGQMIVDETFVIETTEAKRNRAAMANASAVVENGPGFVNYGSWYKRSRTSRWTMRETARYYRALSMLGTDFSLMTMLFPKRSRIELKRKFTVEGKIHPKLVDYTLAHPTTFDPTLFGSETDDDGSDVSDNEEGSRRRKRRKID